MVAVAEVEKRPWNEEEAVAKRLLVYRLVEVAEAMVPLVAVKAWRVVEPKCKDSPVVVAPPNIVTPVPVVPPPRVVEAKAKRPF